MLFHILMFLFFQADLKIWLFHIWKVFVFRLSALLFFRSFFETLCRVLFGQVKVFHLFRYLHAFRVFQVFHVFFLRGLFCDFVWFCWLFLLFFLEICFFTFVFTFLFFVSDFFLMLLGFFSSFVCFVFLSTFWLFDIVLPLFALFFSFSSSVFLMFTTLCGCFLTFQVASCFWWSCFWNILVWCLKACCFKTCELRKPCVHIYIYIFAYNLDFWIDRQIDR